MAGEFGPGEFGPDAFGPGDLGPGAFGPEDFAPGDFGPGEFGPGGPPPDEPLGEFGRPGGTPPERMRREDGRRADGGRDQRMGGDLRPRGPADEFAPNERRNGGFRGNHGPQGGLDRGDFYDAARQAVTQRTVKAIVEILTPTQQATWKKLIGEPFQRQSFKKSAEG